jgi:ABC-2 type transport system ATP-binding protein
MVVLRNISKTYAKSGVKAVDNLSLDIANGEIFGFLGPNGAGKTTTIKIITGILKPDIGDVGIDGIDLASDPLAAKRNFCYVPDTPELFTRLKASEYLNFIGDVFEVPSDVRRERITRFAALFKIDSVLNGRISSFSHGMKQKLVLLASLLPDPKNWILDEPLVGLDPEAAYLLKEEMRARVASGKTVFFSTHVMEVAEKLCDRIGIIKDGRMVFAGKVDELKTLRGSDESLESLFLELTGSDAVQGNGDE